MSTADIKNAPTRQNAQLTFKFNQDAGRHGWLRLTPAYSVKLVDDILHHSDPGLAVLDPFSGTGTTLLCAAYRNHTGTGVEINPFLTWLSNAKLARYEAQTISEGQTALPDVLHCVRTHDVQPVQPPSIHNINRWWDTDELTFLCELKGAIDARLDAIGKVRDLFLIAFCRILIRLSNAAFNHQSMSFQNRDTSQGMLFAYKPDFCDLFARETESVLSSAQHNPPGHTSVVCGDSRAPSLLPLGSYDLIITSPPYPNRMSYIRELRPYMYWLGYLNNGRDAGELDWSAIGGTWGIATSRLAEWERTDRGFYPDYFQTLLKGIAHNDNKNGALLANYVAKYFEDMWHHLQNLAPLMSDGAQVHYIIGNSKFYDVLLPVERLYEDMLRQIGFCSVHVSPLRKRNSKKELFEFDVTGTKGTAT